MGDFQVREIKSKEDRWSMYQYALRDIEAFERMLAENSFILEPIKIGAEQELCVVDKHFEPSKSALTLLDAIQDDHYTNELGLYNLEINLDPEILQSDCFSVIEKKLLELLEKGRKKAGDIGEAILMAGILPTINPKHLQFDYMTPIPRYKTLSQMLYNIRGGEFEIYLQGVDDLMASLGSVLFEACNTSFQTHLQIKPSEFVSKFNWAQMISGPVLSACVNSPLLFGRELWSETRIALFKQSLDTRNSKNHLRKKLPRVYFGDDWLRDSPANLWKNELMRFPLIITSDDLRDAVTMLDDGVTPDLRAIRLHNGTTYTWNRMCYGAGERAHLRIECRYLPSGPSVIDEIANFAFWVGLMNAIPENWDAQKDSISFKTVKANFIKASRTGLSTVFDWMGNNLSAKKLLLDTLIPLAKKGLENCHVSSVDIAHYIGIIEKRVTKEQTGADWQTENFRRINRKYKSKVARQELVAQMIHYQQQNIPVHEWDHIQCKKLLPGLKENYAMITAEHIMSTDIYTVHEEASLTFIRGILKWRNVHHLPIENTNGDLVGIITDGMLAKAEKYNPEARFAEDVMLADVISVDRDTKVSVIEKILLEKNLSGIPVTYKNKLIGMVTLNDLKNELC